MSLLTYFLLSISLGIAEEARDIKFVLFPEGILRAWDDKKKDTHTKTIYQGNAEKIINAKT